MAAVTGVRGAGASSGITSSIQTPVGAAAGDLLVVCHIVDNDITSPDVMTAESAGFTARASYGPQYEPRLKLWTRPLSAGDLSSSWTFRHNTGTSNDRSWALIALSCSEVDPDNPIDAGPVTGYAAGSTTTFSAPTLTATVAGGISLVFGSGTRYSTSDTGNQFFTPPAAWTERYDVGQLWLKPVVYARNNVTGATGSANATITGGGAGNGYSSMHVILKHKSASVAVSTSGFLPFF